MKDSESGLIWDLLEHLFYIDIKIGEVFWKNPSGNNAANLRGTEAGCHVHKHGYVIIYINKKAYKRHRLIWFYANKKWPKGDLDHIDGSKNNDGIDNLREATHAQNMQNCKIRSHNTSGIKGVHWDRRRLKWKAAIKANGKEIYIGRFNTIEAAALARLVAEEKYHGEFRRAA